MGFNLDSAKNPSMTKGYAKTKNRLIANDPNPDKNSLSVINKDEPVSIDGILFKINKLSWENTIPRINPWIKLIKKIFLKLNIAKSKNEVALNFLDWILRNTTL